MEDKKKFVEQYKKIGGVIKEGSNAEIEGTHKYWAFFDKAKPERKAVKKRKRKK